MESKIIVKTKNKLQSTEEFLKNLQDEIDQYLNNGYKIKTGNITTDNMYMYIMYLLVKE